MKVGTSISALQEKSFFVYQTHNVLKSSVEGESSRTDDDDAFIVMAQYCLSANITHGSYIFFSVT